MPTLKLIRKHRNRRNHSDNETFQHPMFYTADNGNLRDYKRYEDDSPKANHQVIEENDGNILQRLFPDKMILDINERGDSTITVDTNRRDSGTYTKKSPRWKKVVNNWETAKAKSHSPIYEEGFFYPITPLNWY